MRHGGRWLWAGALAGLLAALLGYTASLSRRPPEPESERAGAAGSKEASAPPKLFTHSAQCRECHAETYAEWSQDQHATSWREPLYKTYSRDYTQIECLPCHAPRPMLDVGLEREPQLRPYFRFEGVDCLACHLRDGQVCGTLGSGASCGGVLEPALKTSRACYHCHSAHNLFREYQDSEQFRKGMICQDCHMEKVSRPVASGGPPRYTRRHLFKGGGHDPERLKKALKLDLAVAGRELTVTVTNVGAAHGVPGEINNRLVRLEVNVLAPPGRPGEPETELLAREEIFRAPRRLARDKVPSTQVLPGQPRVLRYPLPAPHGKVRATLTYKLQDFILDADATPMARAELEF